MTYTSSILNLSLYLKEIETYLSNQAIESLEYRSSPGKWSKKEILGHLIDSAINNLQRFTEIQFSEQPYSIRPYAQANLVQANDYQNADIKELLSIWKSLNMRILKVIENYSEELLQYRLMISRGKTVSLEEWILDYVNHMEHHLKQILN